MNLVPKNRPWKLTMLMDTSYKGSEYKGSYESSMQKSRCLISNHPWYVCFETSSEKRNWKKYFIISSKIFF